MTKTIFLIVMWLLIVVFLLFLYCALRLSASEEIEMENQDSN